MPVLVVDDNAHACRLLSAILIAVTRAEVRTCKSPEEAYELLSWWPPGLIITDFKMSPVDGLDFARELRANDALGFQYKAILMMTAETPNRKLVERVRAAGIDTMITKPIVPDTLIRRMIWAAKQAKRREQEALDDESGIWMIG